jgi:hypothetical protein
MGSTGNKVSKQLEELEEEEEEEEEGTNTVAALQP